MLMLFFAPLLQGRVQRCLQLCICPFFLLWFFFVFFLLVYDQCHCMFGCNGKVNAPPSAFSSAIALCPPLCPATPTPVIIAFVTATITQICRGKLFFFFFLSPPQYTSVCISPTHDHPCTAADTWKSNCATPTVCCDQALFPHNRLTSPRPTAGASQISCKPNLATSRDFPPRVAN